MVGGLYSLSYEQNYNTRMGCSYTSLFSVSLSELNPKDRIHSYIIEPGNAKFSLKKVQYCKEGLSYSHTS